MHPDDSDISSLVKRVNEGDAKAREVFADKVNDSLHGLARRFMATERRNHTLQPSALVNEAWAEILGHGRYEFASRKAFLATATKIMRHILVNHARRTLAAKRGGDRQRVTDSTILLQAYAPTPLDLSDFLDLHEALQKLEHVDPDAARVIDLRFFAELTIEQCAEVLGVSPTTVQNRYNEARAWLREKLSQK